MPLVQYDTSRCSRHRCCARSAASSPTCALFPSSHVLTPCHRTAPHADPPPPIVPNSTRLVSSPAFFCVLRLELSFTPPSPLGHLALAAHSRPLNRTHLIAHRHPLLSARRIRSPCAAVRHHAPLLPCRRPRGYCRVLADVRDRLRTRCRLSPRVDHA